LILVLLLPAAELGGVDSVSVLIEKNAYLEARSDTEATPLHLAASAGAIDTVMILANAGANIGELVLERRLFWFPLPRKLLVSSGLRLPSCRLLASSKSAGHPPALSSLSRLLSWESHLKP